jgi:predicted nucleic acid-binding Zn ribbon protein
MNSKRKWVGLTDAETETLVHHFSGDPHTLLDEVNARLKERNYG